MVGGRRTFPRVGPRLSSSQVKRSRVFLIFPTAKLIRGTGGREVEGLPEPGYQGVWAPASMRDFRSSTASWTILASNRRRTNPGIRTSSSTSSW